MVGLLGLPVAGRLFQRTGLLGHGALQSPQGRFRRPRQQGRLLEIAAVSSSGACGGCTPNQCSQMSEGLCEITVTTTDGLTGTASVQLELVCNECCVEAYPEPRAVTVVVP